MAKLRDLKFTQAANLVDDPANELARIVLFKRSVRKQPDVGSVHVDRPDELTTEGIHQKNAKDEAARTAATKEHTVATQNKKQSIVKRLMAMFKAAEAEGLDLEDWTAQEAGEAEHMKTFAQKLGDALAGSVDGAALIGQMKALHKELCDKLAESDASKEAARKAAEADADAAADADGRVTKLRSDVDKRIVDLQKKVEAAETRATEAEKIAKAEHEARELEVEKVHLRKFRYAVVDADKQAPMFLKARLTDPPLYEAMIANLAAVNERVSKVEILERDLGSPLGGASDAWTEIEAEASKIVQKGEKGMTQEKAIDHVMQMRPDLVKRHRAEQGQSVQ